MGVTVGTETRIEAGLDGARARTLALLAPVDDTNLIRQVSPLMSPLVWDLAHVGHYEELWLLRNIVGAAPTNELFDDVYDAFKHPRRDRPSLPILGPDEARGFVADVRARVLDALATLDLEGDDPLLRDGFVYGMVVQHEHQHDETMLATIQLMDGFAHPDADGWRPSSVDHDAGGTAAGMVDVPGGVVSIGTDERAWVYDNERPRNDDELAAFRIDRTPVTNRQYRAFVEDGGYDEERLWAPDGWAWRQEAAVRAPRGPSARRAGPARQLVRGGRVRALAGRAPPERSRMGGGRGTRRRSGRAATDARRRLGMDSHRLRRIPGVRALPLPGVLGGVLRIRVQGAAGRILGDRSHRPAGDVPELGLPDPPPDLRRRALRRRRLDRRVPPSRIHRTVHLARGPDPRARALAAPAGIGAAVPDARPLQRRR